VLSHPIMFAAFLRYSDPARFDKDAEAKIRKMAPPNAKLASKTVVSPPPLSKDITKEDLFDQLEVIRTKAHRLGAIRTTAQQRLQQL
jgi:hypothetical protein